ncbi:MAG: hypothetical protein ACLPY1_10675 [Terracidiphilus sp.]
MATFGVKLKPPAPTPFIDNAGRLNQMETYRLKGETARGSCVSLVYQWIKRSKEAGRPLRLNELKRDLGAVQMAQSVYELKDARSVGSAEPHWTRFGLVKDTAQSEGPFPASNYLIGMFQLERRETQGVSQSSRYYERLRDRAQEIATRIASKRGYVELGLGGTQIENDYGHSIGAYAGTEYIYFDPNKQIEGFGSDKSGFEYTFRDFLMTYYGDLISNKYEIIVVS